MPTPQIAEQEQPEPSRYTSIAAFRRRYLPDSAPADESRQDHGLLGVRLAREALEEVMSKASDTTT